MFNGAKRIFKVVVAANLVVALSYLWLTTTHAQGPAPTPAETKAKKEKDKAMAKEAVPPPPSTAREMTAADLETFLDGLIPLQIGSNDIGGVVIAVVKDGKPLFAKGYGYSDVEKKIPVSPENTLFRPGSISKLFTWTAVMQQVELGKLDLDKDVNEYLEFKVPAKFGKPLTLREIMTHRSGFEETVNDLFVQSDKDLRPLTEYLPSHMPAQIFQPGEVPAYSNYATTLAAHMVENVTHQLFDDYVEQHILQPLNMAHATFRQPLPAALQPLMSHGYGRASQPAKPFENIQVAPAGSLSASAEAMTHFMIAHLQNGKYGDAQILKPETAVQMHARQDGWPKDTNAMALGFYEEAHNGHRIIGHGGDTEAFHSDLHLILDSNVGFFVSYNSAGKGEGNLRGYLFNQFMDRYFPVAPTKDTDLPTAAQDAASVAGSYTSNRGFVTNILSATAFLGQTDIVVDPKDNTIYTEDIKDLNGEPMHFREIAPMEFRNVNGRDKLIFQNNSIGQKLVYTDFPFETMQPVSSLLNRKGFNYFVLIFSLGVILLTLLCWPLGALIRKHYGQPLALAPDQKRLRRLVFLFCFVDLAFIGILTSLASKLFSAGGLGARGTTWLVLLELLGLVVGVGALVTVYAAIKKWGDSRQWFWSRLWSVLLAFGSVGFFWFIFHWNFLTFHFRY